MVIKKYSRAEFMRLAKVKKVSLRMIRFYGKTKDEILSMVNPDSISLRRVKDGVFDNFRVITKVQSESVQLDGESWLNLPLASLMSFDGGTLRVYATGFSPLTNAEKAALYEWSEVTKTTKFIERAAIDVMTDGSSTYWQRKSFFESRGMAQLLGHEFCQGRKLNFERFEAGVEACVADTSVRGDLIFEYDVKVED